MNQLAWVIVTASLLFSSTSFAFRCGHSLVQIGDTQDYVNDVCGEPDNIRSHYERRANAVRADNNQFSYNGIRQFPNQSAGVGISNYAEIEVLVEDWTYDFGSERLNKIIRFENGRLVEIESLGRRKHHR